MSIVTQRSECSVTNGTLPYAGAFSCLVVEDQMLIALDLESMLLDCGALKVAIASTVPQALKLIQSEKFDAAFLDVRLGETTTISIAEALRKQLVPFVFSTGFDIKMALPTEFQMNPVLAKPYNDHDVCKAVALLLGRPNAD